MPRSKQATAIAQLKSPHVVRIHDVGSAGGTPFFVMERLEGEDLAHRLARVRRLPVGVVTAIVVQMCKALARVHELGVVHRDLKPGNVFLTDVDGDLVVKLVDFGIAKQRDADVLNATSDGTILGTPLYMSPEQVLSTRDVTPASDLYSLAVVVYECFAGEPPFSGETLGALHVAIATGRYIPISTVDPSLPMALDAWFARALSPHPGQRFASAQEMAETFLTAARGRTSHAPVSVSEAWSGVAPAVAGPSHAGWLRAMAGVVGGLVLLALVVGIVLGRQSGRRAKEGVVPEPSAARAAAPAVSVEAGARREAEANVEANANAANADAKASAKANPAAAAPAFPRGVAVVKPVASVRPSKDRGF